MVAFGFIYLDNQLFFSCGAPFGNYFFLFFSIEAWVFSFSLAEKVKKASWRG